MDNTRFESSILVERVVKENINGAMVECMETMELPTTMFKGETIIPIYDWNLKRLKEQKDLSLNLKKRTCDRCKSSKLYEDKMNGTVVCLKCVFVMEGERVVSNRPMGRNYY